MKLELLYTGLGVLSATAIIVYSTFLFVKRLKKGDKATRGLGGWLKHILEAILGL